MQSTRRLLATVNTTASARHAAKYLNAGDPTGLTGLVTHPSPRAQLIYIYTNTLEKLSSFPSSSAYRAAAEAITKHRLSVVDSVQPEGLAGWQQRTAALVEANKERFGILARGAPKERVSEWVEARIWDQSNVSAWGKEIPNTEWDGEKEVVFDEGGIQTAEEELKTRKALIEGIKKSAEGAEVNWERAPPLEAKQVAEIEEKIGAGLLEEIIEVARGEYVVAHKMAETKPWEELVEKAPQGQWQYFARE